MGKSINPMGTSKAWGGAVCNSAPDLIVLMSLQPAISWQVALLQCPPPLHRPDSMFHPSAGTVNHHFVRGGEFSTGRMGNFQPELTALSSLIAVGIPVARYPRRSVRAFQCVRLLCWMHGVEALPVALPLSLPVLFGSLGMTLPVLLLLVGMRGPPLPLTIARDLRVLRVRAQLLTVVVGPAPTLTIHCAANALIGPILRGLKRLLAILAATRRQAAISSGVSK